MDPVQPAKRDFIPSTTAAFDAGRAIYVNEYGSYKLYFADAPTVGSPYKLDPGLLPFSIVKITKSDDTAITAGDVKILY